MQAFPVDPGPFVEQLCHEGDVVEVGFAGDVVRSDQRGQPNPFCTGDDEACPAELCPLRVLLVRVGVFALELVVQLLRLSGKIIFLRVRSGDIDGVGWCG